jgi:hypothetical protein
LSSSLWTAGNKRCNIVWNCHYDSTETYVDKTHVHYILVPTVSQPVQGGPSHTA